MKICVVFCLAFVAMVCCEDSKCQQQVEPGKCLPYILRYAFNPAINDCELFIYGGCEGNTNRFETMEECRVDCVYPQMYLYKGPQ